VGDQRQAETSNADGRDIVRQEAGLPKPLFKPPLHDGCRCFDSPALLDDGTWVVVWQTRNDDVTCTDPYPVPWGETQGCKEMQGRVISEGPYFGMPVEQARVIAAENAVEGPTVEEANEELGQVLDEYVAGRAQGRW